jgi:YbbR domain-containing protein
MDLNVEAKPEKPKPAAPQQQPSPLNYYSRAVASEMRRFRNGFTRENVTGFLKNMAWTIPITILIWVYAEREQEVLETDQTIAIEVTSKDHSKVVSLAPGEKAIMCDLKGPRSNVDRFKASLSTSEPITIDLDTHNLPNQEEPILTLENLKENPRFKEAGVTIEKCTPPTLTVFVDTVETRQLPVQAPANIPGLKNATFNPPTVSVTGPSRVLEQMAHVTADIGSLPSLNQPGPHAAEKVSLVADAISSLTYSPAQVDATLTVEEKDVVYTCKNVPVWFDIQPTTADQFAIQVVNNGGFVPKVEVIGPPEQIARLRRGDVAAPRAVLEIGPDNVRNTNPVPLRIEGLPDGVRLNGPNPEISFTATPRS